MMRPAPSTPTTRRHLPLSHAEPPFRPSGNPNSPGTLSAAKVPRLKRQAAAKSHYERTDDNAQGWPQQPAVLASRALFAPVRGSADDAGGGRLAGQDGCWEATEVEAIDKLVFDALPKIGIFLEREAESELILQRAEYALGGLNMVRSGRRLHERIQVVILPRARARALPPACAQLSPAGGWWLQLLACQLKIDTGWRCELCAVRRPGDSAERRGPGGCFSISSRCSRANGYIPGYERRYPQPHDMMVAMDTDVSSDDSDEGDEDHWGMPIVRLTDYPPTVA